jgi:hypothetical protein
MDDGSRQNSMDSRNRKEKIIIKLQWRKEKRKEKRKKNRWL